MLAYMLPNNIRELKRFAMENGRAAYHALNRLFSTWKRNLASPRLPDLKVLGWLDGVDEDRVFISVAFIPVLRGGLSCCWVFARPTFRTLKFDFRDGSNTHLIIRRIYSGTCGSFYVREVPRPRIIPSRQCALARIVTA